MAEEIEKKSEPNKGISPVETLDVDNNRQQEAAHLEDMPGRYERQMDPAEEDRSKPSAQDRPPPPSSSSLRSLSPFTSDKDVQGQKYCRIQSLIQGTESRCGKPTKPQLQVSHELCHK